MSDDPDDLIDTIMSCAHLMGVPCFKDVDTFGRVCLIIERAGLRRMHGKAVADGHHEVAEHIRQMLARKEF